MHIVNGFSLGGSVKCGFFKRLGEELFTILQIDYGRMKLKSGYKTRPAINVKLVNDVNSDQKTFAFENVICTRAKVPQRV